MGKYQQTGGIVPWAGINHMADSDAGALKTPQLQVGKWVPRDTSTWTAAKDPGVSVALSPTNGAYCSCCCCWPSFASRLITSGSSSEG